MKRIIYTFIIGALSLVMSVHSHALPDEKDYDESVRLPVRKLHPEREFDKMMKQMHKEHEQKAAEKEEKEAKKAAKKQAKEEAKKEKEGAKNKGSKHDTRVIPPRPQQQQASTADKSLMKELLSKDYSIKKYEPIYEQPKPITWKNDPVSRDVNELLTHVSGTSKGGVTLYTPKGISMTNDANEVFFCFESTNGQPRRLHLRVQYYADDPLNYSDISFTIDGFNYEFRPSRPSRGKLGARMYWEQSEDALTAQHKDLVYALSHCHWARMSLKGADGMNHVKMLSQKQLDAFARVLELYRAMGGSF